MIYAIKFLDLHLINLAQSVGTFLFCCSSSPRERGGYLTREVTGCVRQISPHPPHHFSGVSEIEQAASGQRVDRASTVLIR